MFSRLEISISKAFCHVKVNYERCLQCLAFDVPKKRPDPEQRYQSQVQLTLSITDGKIVDRHWKQEGSLTIVANLKMYQSLAAVLSVDNVDIAIYVGCNATQLVDWFSVHETPFRGSEQDRLVRTSSNSRSISFTLLQLLLF